MRTISVSAKCSDCCYVEYHNDENERSFSKDGYVPDLGFGSGDYIDFVVDADTGQILNWVPVSDSEAKFELT